MKNSVAKFELFIDFEKESPDPQRVFKVIQRLIGVMAEMDETLAKALDTRFRTELVLEDVLSGSIRAIIRTVLEWIPDEGLKELSWQKIVGGILVKIKYIWLKKLEDKPGFSSADQLRALQAEIDAQLQSANINPMDAYGTLHRGILADITSDLTKALSGLRPGDLVEYRSAAGNVRLNPYFNTANLSQLASEGFETVRQKALLKVKKMDLLGDSRWTFRLNDKRSIDARIADTDWLQRFHNKEVVIGTGDWLETELEVSYLHGAQQAAVQIQYTVLHVYRVFNPNASPPSDQPRFL